MSDESDSDESSVNDCGIPSILPIQQQDVHRIVSGQVISDMASAVKELVDNALDAGATSINIRLFNQGIDVIEVSDDGTGIPKHSRPLVAMKHATSKILSFDDLYKDVLIDGQMKPNHLGFRGEALFSLVQISQNLIVCTRTENEEMAQQIQFNRDGYLDPKSVKDVARKVGTTVAVVKLFDKLPVRRADMIKRLKSQRAKLLKLMQAYAVLCVGVGINVYDKSGPGYTKTDIKMSTSEKSKNIKETISSIFGSQFLSGLCMLRVDLSSIVAKALMGKIDESKINKMKNLWRIEGMVSNAPNATNKNVAREIQFFSINGRPVELPKVSRLLTEVWRNFESTDGSKKRPACILGFYLPNSMFDVNVTPDKREVFVSNENEIYELLRLELQNVWAMQTEGTFVANAVEKESNNDKKENFYSLPKMESLDESRKSSLERLSNDTHDSQVAARPIHRKMKRRNAFVRSFDNIGSATTDEHLSSAETSFRHHSTEPSFNQNEPVSMVNAPLGRIVESKFESDEESSMPLKKKLRYDTASVLEQRLWNQTKLSFNTLGSKSQRDEINELKSFQNNKSTTSTTTEKGSEEPLISSDSEDKKLQHEKSNFPNANENTKVISTNTTQESSNLISIKDKSFGYNQNIENTKVPSPVTTSTNLDSSILSVSDTPKLSMSNLESPSPITNKVTPTSTKLSINNNESPSDILSSDSPTSEKSSRSPINKNDDNELSPEEEEKDDDDDDDETEETETNDHNKISIVWNNFQNTENVIKQANEAHTMIMNQRKKLKQIKISRSNLYDDHDDDNHDDDNHDDQQNDDQQNTNMNLKEKESSNKENNVVKLSKEEFLTMTIVGQFNHGFILALCQNGNLWILDQHACDEKYNFERLVRETKIHEQTLIQPLPLELSPSEENCILENMDIFEQNGFRFSYDETKEPRNRLSLTALPHSGSGGDGKKAVQFGKEDVGALCAILGADGGSSNAISGSGTGADGNGSMGNNAVRRHAGGGIGTNGEIIRLPKSIAMFASRACRSSIMIGDALSQKKMEEVVKRLCKVEQPWTCPHGRPTVRHIRDLLDDLLQDEKMSSKVVAGDFAAFSQDL